MPSLFKELRRRNVVRVGIAYLVVAWLLIEVASVLEPALLLPDWVDRVVTVFLLIGFPIVVIFAWAFEITPDGIKLTSKVDPEQSITRTTGKKLEHTIIVLLTIAVAIFAAREFMLPRASVPDDLATSAPASIAVLPFEDFSESHDQEYFSKGIAEEILNLLAKTNALRVAARTSSFAFAGSDMDIRDIGEKLDVGTVLEGSIRKSGPTIRITAQLIDVENGYHLWSETYDRNYADIFKIQDEIAAAILASLRVHLLGEAVVPILQDAERTVDMDAYSAYLIGNERMDKRTKEEIESAIVKFEEAIAIDDSYAPAHVKMAQALLLLDRYEYGGDHEAPEAVDARVLPHLDKALALAPDSAEAIAVSGYHHLQRNRYDEAAEALDRALALNPSYAPAYSWRADTAYAQRRYLDMLADKEKAYALDPMSLEISRDLAYEYGAFWRPKDADRVIQRMFERHPDHPLAYDAALDNLSNHGRNGEALLLVDKALASDPDNETFLEWKAWLLTQIGLPDEAIAIGDDDVSFYAQWVKRDYSAAKALLDENLPGADSPFWYQNAIILYHAMGRDTGEAEFTGLVNQYIDALESRNPSWRDRCYFRLIYDLRETGTNDAAIESMLAACHKQYEERLKVSYLCPCTFFGVVMFTAVDGRVEEAIERADQWLSSGDASVFLRADLPVFANIAQHPRFNELLDRNEEQLKRQREIYAAGSL